MVSDLKGELLKLTAGIGDGVVALASTPLDGVPDYITVNGNHLSMIRNVTMSSKRIPPGVPIILERVRAVWPTPTRNNEKIP